MKRSAIVLTILIIIGGIVYFQGWESPPKFGYSEDIRLIPEKTTLPGLKDKQVKTEIQKKQQAVYGTSQALSALERICPRLTEDEEDDLLRKSGRSPDVLGALALLQSRRSSEFIDEALQKNPDHLPSLWAAAFLLSEPGRRLQQAKKLCTLEPNDSAPFVAAGCLSALMKDKTAALSSLKEAAQKNGFADRETRWNNLMELQYTDAGRSLEQAKARMSLQRSQAELSAVLMLGKGLGMVEWNFQSSQASVEAQMNMLAVVQKIDSNPFFDATCKTFAASREHSALIAINESDNADISKYFSTAPAEALAESERHLVELRKLDSILGRKDEVFDRLPNDAILVKL